MQRGNGNGNGDGHAFHNPMQEALEKAQTVKFTDAAGRFIGTLIGTAFDLFLVPVVIVYAYNGLQPEIWADISYLPTVAGLFVFRILIRMIRDE